MLETPPALLMFGCVHKPMYALPRVRYRCQWKDDRLDRDVGIASMFESSPSGALISLGNKHTTVAISNAIWQIPVGGRATNTCGMAACITLGTSQNKYLQKYAEHANKWNPSTQDHHTVIVCNSPTTQHRLICTLQTAMPKVG